MQRCELDHIVVVAASREAGIAWVEAVLGVPLEWGGEHERMGTHNALLRLGDSNYLEVISVNPAAPPPNRSRWFGLDRFASDSPPKLATWVARTHDLGVAVATSIAPLGEIEQMSRGALNWRIAVRREGSLLYDGAFPTVIEWAPGRHPALGMADRGCTLTRLEAFNPEPGLLAAALEPLGLGDAISINALPGEEQPYLKAYIDTPHGPRAIGGPKP